MDPFAIIAQRIDPGATLERRWPLRGGVSAHVDALELRRADGALRRVVVRRHGAAAWKPIGPDVTATEHAVLHALARAGLAVPEPLLLDTSSEVLPSPYLVMELVDGTTDLDPAALPSLLGQMARFLARLHALHIAELALPPLPDREDPIDEVLKSIESDRLRAALASRRPFRSPNPPSLLHGDFWPGNVLWRDGDLAAVLDWEDVAVGDPLSDVASCRVELLWRYGEEAMKAFTAEYLSVAHADTADLPIWELYVATTGAASMGDWGLEPSVEATMRAATLSFIERAEGELSRRLA